MKAAVHSPRPTLREFLTCCRAEFRFLSDYGFRELLDGSAGHPDPFRFRMAGEFLELYVHGIDYGSRSSVSLRDREGREFFVSRLVSASRDAARLARRRHPDGQRADIAAAAAALRGFPTLFTASDLAATIIPPSEAREA